MLLKIFVFVLLMLNFAPFYSSAMKRERTPEVTPSSSSAGGTAVKRQRTTVYGHGPISSRPLKHLPAEHLGPTVLVTGSNRGIGLDLVKQLMRDKSVKLIIATYKDENSKREELLHMAANSERHGKPLIKIFEMDITNETGVIATAKAVKDLLDGKKLKLNTLINNAGYMQNYEDDHGVDPLEVKKAVYMTHMEINFLGPALITTHFHKMLDETNPRIVFISSTAGSFTEFDGIRKSQNVVYPASKAALNMYMLSVSVIPGDDQWKGKVPNWTAISICPGWVATEMGNKVTSTEIKPVKPEDAAFQVVDVMRKMEKHDNGKFYSLFYDDFIGF